MQGAYDWVVRNKKAIAGILGAVMAGMMAYTGTNAEQIHQYAAYLGYVVAWLGGAGLHESDKAVKAAQAEVKG